MVYHPDGAVLASHAVAALAVGVVDDHVEDGNGKEGVGTRLAQGEEVLVWVGVDEELERAQSVRSIPHDGGRDGRPPKRPGQDIGRHFALAQCPLREVPQRRLPVPRLVHGEKGVLGVGHLGQERVVRRIWHQTERPDLALGQDAKDAVRDLCFVVHCSPLPRWPLRAGQRWPSGSIGFPQRGHRGRPAAHTSAPWRASESICSRVAQKRTRPTSGSSPPSVSRSSSSSSASRSSDPSASATPSSAPNSARPPSPPASSSAPASSSSSGRSSSASSISRSRSSW